MTRAQIVARLDAYERLIRLDKPIGTLLLLWPTLWAIWIASAGRPRLDVLLVFLAKESGNRFNNLAGCRKRGL